MCGDCFFVVHKTIDFINILYKPPLIKWAYGQKLWEKLETAAFCPRLMQIAWPWVPARRDLLLEMLPEVQSPQPSQGGGDVNYSLVPLLATLFWLWFSSVYPHGIFYTLAFNSVAFGLSFCLLFCTFSELSAAQVIFWKSCSRVDGSSIFTILGSVKWYKKRTPIGFQGRCVLGKHFFQ